MVVRALAMTPAMAPRSYDLKSPTVPRSRQRWWREAKGARQVAEPERENAQKGPQTCWPKATTRAAKSADTGFAQRRADAVRGVVDGWVAELQGRQRIGGDKLTGNLAAAERWETT